MNRLNRTFSGLDELRAVKWYHEGHEGHEGERGREGEQMNRRYEPCAGFDEDYTLHGELLIGTNRHEKRV